MIHFDSPLYALIWSTRPLLQGIEAMVAAGLPDGVTVRTRAVLEALTEGPAPVPEIARRLHIQRQYVQVMVNDALAAGFTELRSNPAHARSRLVALTKSGRVLIDQIRARETDTLVRMAEGLSPSDIETALSVMTHLRLGFDQKSGGTAS